MRKIVKPELRPVVHFAPWEFDPEFRLPAGLHLRSDTERKVLIPEYLAATFAKLGLPTLNAMVPGTTNIAMEDFTPAHWRWLLRHQLKGLKLDDWQRSLPNIPGGWMVLSEGQIEVWSGCCSDLGNLGSWQDALAAPVSDDWKMLWNGHPWHCFQASSQSLILSQTSDGDEDCQPQLEITRADWQQMLQTAIPLLQHSLSQIQAMLQTELPDIDAQAFSLRWLSTESLNLQP